MNYAGGWLGWINQVTYHGRGGGVGVARKGGGLQAGAEEVF